MKYTDGLFSFPVRVYDGFSIKKALRREDDLEMPVDGDWVEGIARIPFNEVKGFVDYFSKGRAVEDVESEGFDCCVVLTNTVGDFVCNCSQKELIKRLDSFVQWYYENVEAVVAEKVQEKIQTLPPQKKTWWKKFRR